VILWVKELQARGKKIKQVVIKPADDAESILIIDVSDIVPVVVLVEPQN
jgi:hypothetical protein